MSKPWMHFGAGFIGVFGGYMLVQGVLHKLSGNSQPRQQTQARAQRSAGQSPEMKFSRDLSKAIKDNVQKERVGGMNDGYSSLDPYSSSMHQAEISARDDPYGIRNHK